MNYPSNVAYYQTADNIGGYGGMAYYSSATCGYDGSNWVETGCTTDYAQSKVKNVVDAWKVEQASSAIEARLIQENDLGNLGYEWINTNTSGGVTMTLKKTVDTPAWVYNNNYVYWTMSQYNNSTTYVLILDNMPSLGSNIVFAYRRREVVRPVIVLPKSAISS